MYNDEKKKIRTPLREISKGSPSENKLYGPFYKCVKPHSYIIIRHFVIGRRKYHNVSYNKILNPPLGPPILTPLREISKGPPSKNEPWGL